MIIIIIIVITIIIISTTFQQTILQLGEKVQQNISQSYLGDESCEKDGCVVLHLGAGLDADGDVSQLDPPLLVADVNVPPLAQ